MRIDTAFLALAGVCLIVGACLGIYMGINEDFQLVAVHAHVNLAGWVSLALFGAIYRLYPELSRPRMARFHFGLSAVGALLLPPGIYLAEFHRTPLLAIVGSLLWLAGALIFFAAIARLAFSRRSRAIAVATGK